MEHLVQPWGLREVRPVLVDSYRAAGQWTDETFGALLHRSLSRHARLGFSVHSSVHPFSGTVGDVLEMAHRFAGGLARLGISPGDSIVIQLPNWHEAAVALIGGALRGLVVVPVPPFSGPVDLVSICRETNARCVVLAARFGTRDYLEEWAHVRAQLPTMAAVVVGPAAVGMTRFVELLDGPSRAANLGRDADPSGPAIIGFTSGSEGAAKGVVHSHRTLGAEVRQLAAVQAPDDLPMLVGSPLAHAIGLLSGLLLPLQLGRPIHLMDSWAPRRVLQVMESHQTTSGSGSAFFMQSLLEDPAFSDTHQQLIRYVGLGGAPTPAPLVAELRRRGISTVRMYGSTEHPSITGSRHSDPENQKTRTDGKPLAGVEVKVVRPDGTLASPDEEGQIFSRGPDLAIGYTDPALTARAFDRDGWYDTRDLGAIDERGCLRISGRRGRLIIRGGENLSPAEIEDALCALPGITAAIVVGIKDPRLGERVAAAVEMNGAREGVPSLHEIRSMLTANGLSPKKLPERVRIVRRLPRTSVGKPDHAALLSALEIEEMSEIRPEGRGNDWAHGHAG
jgi:acyl-CoA synthetase